MVQVVKNMLYLKKILLHHFRPNKEKTGHVSDSGSSVIRHGLNPEKVFMQVHYLKVSLSEWQKPGLFRFYMWTVKVSKKVGAKQTYRQHCKWHLIEQILIVQQLQHFTPSMKHESKEGELFPSLYLPSPRFTSALKSRILKLLSGSY